LSTTTTASIPKKHTSAPLPGTANGSTNGGDDGGVDPSNPQTSQANGDNSGANNSALSPGLIALLVVILLAILAGVLLSCHRIRQSRRRRRQSWDEDILKNHAGSVGYSETGGYGMYVGSGSGMDRPDLWRKNLDLFHRE
jgi:hypothetical protein